MTTSPSAGSVGASVERALERSSGVTFTPATVVEWIFEGTAGGISYDSDIDDLAEEDQALAVNGTGLPLRPGTRVMVAMTPPSGALVMSHLTPFRLPQILMANAANLPVATGALAILNLGTVEGDDDMITPTGGSDFQVQVEGSYQLEATVEFAVSATGLRFFEFYVTADDGSYVSRYFADRRPGVAAESIFISASMTIDLNALDHVTVRGRHTSGANLDVGWFRFRAIRMGPLAPLGPVVT